ncbi:MAG: glycine oxidase ThiO [Pseudomonadota bacterium]|nr:glycine oxidase ThiO [Pseudomonadota bacterium]
MADCIVIGGGLIGLLSARELAAGGLSVLLLERGETGREASWAGGGILSPLHPWRYAPAVTALAAWSQARYGRLAEELRADTGVDPQWTRSGLLTLEVEDQEAALAWAKAHGVRMECPPDGGLSLEPALETPRRQVLWMPDIAQIRNPRLVRAVRVSLTRWRVEVREHTPVLRLLVHQQRVLGVATPQGEVQAGHVVIAGGAWSRQLLEDREPAPAIAPVRGQMLLFQCPPGWLRRMVLHGDHYVIPRRDGQVLAGSTVEHVGFNKATTPQGREQLHQAAVALVPALAGCPVQGHWAGLRPSAPAGIPYIGGHPAIRGLYVNAGQYRNGIVTAPASARLLADLLLHRTPSLDPAPYALAAWRASEQP